MSVGPTFDQNDIGWKIRLCQQIRNVDFRVLPCLGGMVLPHYNTRASWLVMVVEGKGRFEMACPHLGSQSQRQGHYQKVQGSLSVGDVFVIPARHPLKIIANEGSNLRMAGFAVNGHCNRLNFLAGQESIWRNLDREAKELSFNIPAREIEEILEKQNQSYFVAGPEQEQQHVSSILDLVLF
ncbi:hypothetical protein T459_08006 [Capsicum annuum]|uniref:Cupin type-1 domain-containing protein n=1 Tax=Capsicum annuum TaxID=4072 RepID=A0A2G2ZV97_CAPAN|nr:hypothetical protein T459_08006 [Capsicum annuum]